MGYLKNTINFTVSGLRRLLLQHNGVVEKMNRTIKERVHCMLSHAKLPKSFVVGGHKRRQ